MAIDFNTLGKNLAPKVRNTSQQPAKEAVKAPSNTKGADVAEKVNLSSQAQELYQANSQQGVNETIVEAIKQQVEEGSYKIDYQSLAAKMLSLESNL